MNANKLKEIKEFFKDYATRIEFDNLSDSQINILCNFKDDIENSKRQIEYHTNRIDNITNEFDDYVLMLSRMR